LLVGGCLPELVIPEVQDDPAHDFDGDGRDDVIVGAQFNDSGGADAGAAYLLGSNW